MAKIVEKTDHSWICPYKFLKLSHAEFKEWLISRLEIEFDTQANGQCSITLFLLNKGYRHVCTTYTSIFYEDDTGYYYSEQQTWVHKIHQIMDERCPASITGDEIMKFLTELGL